MKVKALRFFLSSLLACNIFTVVAQTFPSSLVTSLQNSRTLFLDEYADPFTPRIKTTIYFTDFTESNWQFCLRLKITGPNGLVISSKAGVRPPNPLMVAPGQPFMLQGADLAFYFNYDHLNFSGISRAQLEGNHRLPEGNYTFCFEAVDYESGKLLSHPSCVSAYLTLNDPPIILTPVKGSVVENISMQNILFQWQLNNPTGNIKTTEISYQIDLYEVINNWADPKTAILNNQALLIWQSVQITQKSYLFSNADPPLDKGKRYVFTVRAMENSGRSSFKNNGYSPPQYFHFGYYENDTIDLVSPEEEFQFALSTPSEFKWKKPRRALQNQLVSYTLKLVKINKDQDPADAIIDNAAFMQQTYVANSNASISKTIPVTIWANIERMGNYAWQVFATSGTQQVAKSRVSTFVGPPDIETFIAGGFLMTVTKLTSYDKVNNVISGKCKTPLRAGAEETEFAFRNIALTGIGNNEWAMISGVISDKITTTSYTLQPKTIAENRAAFFLPDSIFVTTSGLKLGGVMEWVFPHAGAVSQVQKLMTRRCKMTLANSSFILNTNEEIALDREYVIPLMEPFGFVMKLRQASVFNVYQSKYEIDFQGLMRLPQNVLSQNSTPVNVVFSGADQLFFISETSGEASEGIRLAQNCSFMFSPNKYTIDLSEIRSPGDFAADSSWKGLYIDEAEMTLPSTPGKPSQLSLPLENGFTFLNTTADTNHAYVDHRGLFLNSVTSFSLGDSVKFNGFVSKAGYFYAKIKQSEIIKAHIRGGILIPVVDTLNSFPYNIDLTDYGLNEGYLVNGLANKVFTFNPAGSTEQRIAVIIKRAVFKGNNRIEMDLDMKWPYFQLQLYDVQRFSVWGNNNIGFDVPNGKCALTYQCTGKSGSYEITVDHLGCGRSGNAYAIGASAKINLDESISGETGPPIVNAYSIYKNPLLTGMVVIPSTVAATTSGGTVSTTNYQSSSAGFTNALGNDLSNAFGALGVNANPLVDSTGFIDTSLISDPLIKNNLISEWGRIIDVIVRLKPFIQDVTNISEEDWATLDIVQLVLKHDVVKRAESMNARELMNYVLHLVLNEIVNRLTQPIQQVSTKAVVKIEDAVNKQVLLPANAKLDETLKKIFDKLGTQLKSQVEQQHHAAVTSALTTIRENLATGIKTSVSNSFNQNITSKITGLVEAGVTAKVKSFVRAEVITAALKLINEGVNAKISLNEILQNSGTMFTSISDTIKDVLMNASGPNLRNTAESLVNDAVSGIDWNAISSQILSELLAKGISSVIATQLSGAVAANAGPFANSLLASVKFDFNNLGGKLQNGQFDKIVKFDPTNIFIQSPAVDIRGTVKFVKNDPVFGDNWQANVFAKIKVPKKDNPVECAAFFLNGKTTQLEDNFSFWYVQLDANGLNIPLNPAPIVWDGAQGFVFSKMSKTGSITIVPDNTNKFGVGCRFFFYDQQSSGKTYLFDLGADAVFNNEGFALSLSGNASILNYQKQNGKFISPGFVTGTGVIGYYKTAQVSKVTGNFNVQLHTSPILCAGGDVGLDLRAANNWKVWIGTQQNPIAVKVLCKNFLSNTAFMDVSNSGFTAGLGMNVDISANSPWVQFTGIKVRGFADLAFGYNAFVSLEWNPAFKINEASVSAWLSAAIGVEYETAAGQNSLTLAGVSMSGELIYKSNPEAEIHGEMSGSITLVGFTVDMDLPVHYSLSKKEIIN